MKSIFYVLGLSAAFSGNIYGQEQANDSAIRDARADILSAWLLPKITDGKNLPKVEASKVEAPKVETPNKIGAVCNVPAWFLSPLDKTKNLFQNAEDFDEENDKLLGSINECAGEIDQKITNNKEQIFNEKKTKICQALENRRKDITTLYENDKKVKTVNDFRKYDIDFADYYERGFPEYVKNCKEIPYYNAASKSGLGGQFTIKTRKIRYLVGKAVENFLTSFADKKNEAKNDAGTMTKAEFEAARSPKYCTPLKSIYDATKTDIANLIAIDNRSKGNYVLLDKDITPYVEGDLLKTTLDECQGWTADGLVTSHAIFTRAQAAAPIDGLTVEETSQYNARLRNVQEAANFYERAAQGEIPSANTPDLDTKRTKICSDLQAKIRDQAGAFTNKNLEDYIANDKIKTKILPEIDRIAQERQVRCNQFAPLISKEEAIRNAKNATVDFLYYFREKKQATARLAKSLYDQKNTTTRGCAADPHRSHQYADWNCALADAIDKNNYESNLKAMKQVLLDNVKLATEKLATYDEMGLNEIMLPGKTLEQTLDTYINEVFEWSNYENYKRHPSGDTPKVVSENLMDFELWPQTIDVK